MDFFPRLLLAAPLKGGQHIQDMEELLQIGPNGPFVPQSHCHISQTQTPEVVFIVEQQGHFHILTRFGAEQVDPLTEHVWIGNEQGSLATVNLKTGLLFVDNVKGGEQRAHRPIVHLQDARKIGWYLHIHYFAGQGLTGDGALFESGPPRWSQPHPPKEVDQGRAVLMTGKGRNNVTIKDVAEHAGVSTAVSRVSMKAAGHRGPQEKG